MGIVLSFVKYTSEGIPNYTYDDFTDLARVGQGTYSVVRRGNLRHHSQLVAVKEFHELNEYSDREIQLLKEFSHPNIIAISGVIWEGSYDPSTRKRIHTGYVMEYMELGSLHNRIYDFSTNYNNRLISRWIQQIGAGLQYLHEKKIIHRDIKPKNILLASEDHLKLAGFGLARFVSGRESNTEGHWIGTDSYMAPEVPVSRNYGPAADVFSFGVTIWEIIHRKHPGQHVITSKDSCGNDCVDLPMEENKIHVDASDFIRRCWQTNIPDRPSIAEIIQFGSNFFLSSVKYTPEGIPYYTYDDFKGLTRVGTSSTNSTVKKGYYKEGHDSRPVVVKEFLRLDKYSDREIQLLKGSSHPNIIKTYGVIWDGNYDSQKTQKPIYSGYVMEYMELGSLHNRIYDFSTNYNNRLISRWIQQIGAGLQYLHEKKIIHRDIKPQNILLASEDHLKLADFGHARSVSVKGGNTAAHWIGTDSYMAPEVPVSRNYGSAADVFSFGVTIWEIIHRKYPWLHVTTSKDSCGNDCVDLPMEENKIHVDASNFIRGCWQTNISDRPSIAEIIQFGSNFEQINKKTILIMGGMDENECLRSTMTVLSTDRSDWIELQLELPYDVCSSGAVFLHNELYVVGGDNNLKALYKLDENLKWKRLADMNVERDSITNSCLEANGYIWVFGGVDGDVRFLESVERYDPKEDKWTLMPEMLTARSNAAAVFWKDRIIVCGGWSHDGWIRRPFLTSSAECFLLETGGWTQFPPLPDRLGAHSIVSFENKLIIMGGWNNYESLESVRKMDPLQPKDGWKSLPPMKYARQFFPGLVLDQEIYALGGCGDENTSLDCVEIFDGKSWRDGPSLPYRRKYHSAVVIPQSLADRLCQYKP